MLGKMTLRCTLVSLGLIAGSMATASAKDYAISTDGVAFATIVYGGTRDTLTFSLTSNAFDIVVTPQFSSFYEGTYRMSYLAYTVLEDLSTTTTPNWVQVGSGVGSKTWQRINARPGNFEVLISGAAAGYLNGGGPYAGFYTAQVLAAPIPEPETYAMMLAGLGLLGLRARRRRDKLNA